MLCRRVEEVRQVGEELLEADEAGQPQGEEDAREARPLPGRVRPGVRQARVRSGPSPHTIKPDPERFCQNGVCEWER